MSPDQSSIFRRFGSLVLVTCLIGVGLSGCYVPEAVPLLGHQNKKRILYDVIRGVQCEITRAVRDQIERDKAGE